MQQGVRGNRGEAAMGAAASGGKVQMVDLPAFIDGQPVGRGQAALLLACAAVLFVDGFDAQGSATSPRPSPANGACRVGRWDQSSAPACSA